MKDVDTAARVVLVDPRQWTEIGACKGFEMRKPTRAEVRDLERIVAGWLRDRGMVREVERV